MSLDVNTGSTKSSLKLGTLELLTTFSYPYSGVGGRGGEAKRPPKLSDF